MRPSRRHRRGRGSAGAGVSRHRGMTLIEVMLALAILGAATIGMAAYMTRFARTIALTDVRATADELAASRIEQIKGSPRYATIDSAFAGTQALSGLYAGYTQSTTVVRTGGGPSDLYDYKTVTVAVSNPRLATPVRKTTVIAFF